MLPGGVFRGIYPDFGREIAEICSHGSLGPTVAA
jgi:hypothetical protein